MTDEEGKEYVPFVTLEEGNIFGEMSFLVSRPTSASAVASEHTVLYQITRESFDEIIEEHPHLACQIYQAICKILVYRLNRTDKKVTKIVQDMDEDMLEMHE
ncbi:MAG: Crp/Fnr family transcriptional regulator [bacterium]